MNNNANNGMPTITSVTGGPSGTNQMIIDENSITYFNAQPGTSNLAQQQLVVSVFIKINS